jgi:hypothetical protein
MPVTFRRLKGNVKLEGDQKNEGRIRDPPLRS